MVQANTIIKVLTCVLFTHFSLFVHADVLHFPDENFKAFIIANGFDRDGNGEIESNEAIQVDSLYDVNIYSFSDITGIGNFVNLEYADLGGARIRKGLDFSNNQKLTYLNLDDNWFTSLSLQDNSKLEYLSINNTYSYYLDLSGCQNLQYFSANNCIYTEHLIIPALNDLTELHYAKMPSHIAQRFYKCINLEHIDVPGCYATEFDLSHFRSLKFINLSGSQVQVIDISNCLEIEEVYSKGSVRGLESLHKFTKLRNLIYTNYVYSKENYGYTKLDFSNNPNLQHLKLSREFITELDLSNNPNIESVDLSFCRDLQYLNLKNGSALGYDNAPEEVRRILNTRKCSDLEVVCVDDIELEMVKEAMGSTANNVDFNNSKCKDALSRSALNETALKPTLSFSLFPNPVENELTISLDKVIERMELYSVTGAKIKDLPISNNIQVNNLPSGAYIIRIIAEGEVYSNRFVKK